MSQYFNVWNGQNDNLPEGAAIAIEDNITELCWQPVA
jgi:hypothetical protein